MITSRKKKVNKYELAHFKFTISKLQKMYEAEIIKPDVRVELINGELVMMAPIGFKHMKVVNSLNELLLKIILQKKLEYFVSIQNPVVVSKDNLLYPDVAVFPKSIYESGDIPKVKDAILIVEVSDTTLKYDKDVKLPIYAKGNVKDILIVDLKNEIVERYKNPDGKLFKDIHIYKKNDTVEIFDNSFKLIDII